MVLQDQLLVVHRLNPRHTHPRTLTLPRVLTHIHHLRHLQDHTRTMKGHHILQATATQLDDLHHRHRMHQTIMLRRQKEVNLYHH